MDMHDIEEYDDEINFLDYIKVLRKHYRLIFIIVTVSVLATGIISFRSPEIYQATAAIIPASQMKEQTSMSRLAMKFGISTTPAANVSEIVRLLKSNILMERVIKRYNLLPVFFKKDALQKMPEKSRIWNGIRYLKNIFTVKHNQREGIIELSAEFTDPKTAADIINYMLTELTDYMSGEARRVAETNRKYLESLINKNTDPLISQKIYSLIAKQIEMSMMAEVKDNFAFKILDPPKAPDRKIRPKIKKDILLSFVVSLFAAVFLAFFIEYIGNLKQRESPEKSRE
ncbi:MAG: hypothetical protein GXP46_05800 [Deferribacteres bacterium]|nr:hypothetical protein [Deferribacteres bacterium]